MIEVGNRIPSVDITVVTQKDQETIGADKLFAGKKVVMFGLPGAFTPTCSASHLPGFVVLADEIKAHGVDMIACVSVNDVFVMRAWSEQQNAEEITMLADVGAEFSKALGLAADMPQLGGYRSIRYAMIIEDGIVTKLNVEEPKQFEVSDAKTMLAALST
ncbi:MAG: peroxiredoxin [Chromatiaceae bacterium]|nr:peroxiredoxin [Gammaproteobacteria bacterium]MCB1881567.1 peroxiredoxin [Gammaproteobacteria bacterium]MCP5445658.1 peroxiredoxin [Chromatiaceae bacterium]